MGYNDIAEKGKFSISGYATASEPGLLGLVILQPVPAPQQVEGLTYLNNSSGFNSISLEVHNASASAALADFLMKVYPHKNSNAHTYISGATWGTVAGTLKKYVGAINTLAAAARAFAYVDIGPVWAIEFYAQGNGADILANGDMSSSATWTEGAGWTVAAGVATAVTASTTLKQLLTDMGTPWIEGLAYEVTFTVVRTAGSLTVGSNTDPVGEGYDAIEASGTYSREILADAHADGLIFTGTGFSGTIDNVTLKESPQINVSASLGR